MNKMIIYDRNILVNAKHIKEINRQLCKLGSKVEEKLVNDGNSHALLNVLSLACGGGSFGISLSKINSIENEEFKIDCSCDSSITGPVKN